MNINWLLLSELLYFAILAYTVFRIIYDTNDSSKTLSYLFLVIILPIGGIAIYYTFGVNMRKRNLYKNKLIGDSKLRRSMREKSVKHTERLIAQSDDLQRQQRLIRLMQNTNHSPLTADNKVEVLLNGEKKLPHVLRTLRAAKHHIHIEYYRFEDDEVGREIEAVILEKARAGVEVKMIYDDFGSRSIRRKMADRLREAGADVMPFYKIAVPAFASRINYRNHRKIIVVDGVHGYIGGINVSNDYVNDMPEPGGLYWRDTHLSISGSSVHYLQYVFLNDWNFCCSDQKTLKYDREEFFPTIDKETAGEQAVQITASGPDSDAPTILYSILEAIGQAKKSIQITTPYFIPGESLMDDLCVAAGSGIEVTLLVPEKGDSRLVDMSAASYYGQLLEAGVRVFRYKKGFIHAKTMVVDDYVSIVGTANLDLRSFDLNFEVNAIVYDEKTAKKLTKAYKEDLKEAREMDLKQWEKRSMFKKFLEKLARLFSPIL